MSKGECSLLLAAVVLISVASDSIAQQQSTSKASDGDKLLECSDLTDLTALTLCLSRRFSEVKKKNSARNYGYPYQIAPSLPPFLVADSPPNSITSYPKRRMASSEERHTRIQGYSEPQYRNFLDLDSTLRPRVAEYRPVFDDYAVPVLVYPEVGAPYRKTPKPTHYLKPVKPNNPSAEHPKKPRKLYGHGRYNQPAGHYDRYNTSPQQGYDGQKEVHAKERNTGYSREAQHTQLSNYDRDYYVPANSPIIGDIRRSLFDYTGAGDLMEDEPVYVLRSHRIKEMGNDYYNFRRSFLADLEVNESKAKSSTTRNNENEK